MCCWVTGSFTLHFLIDFFILLNVEERYIFCCILKCFSQQHVVSGMLQSLPVAAFMSMLKGYRPSSALQAIFSVYHGTFNDCLQNFIWTCSIVLLSKGALYDSSSGPQILHALSNTGLTRALKSLLLIAIVTASVLEKDRFIIERTLMAF